MLYKEVEMALGINSFYSKSKLASEYIKVRNLGSTNKGAAFIFAKIYPSPWTYSFISKKI